MPKQVCAFLGLVGYYRKFIKNFAKIAKPLTLLTCQQVKFDWTLTHNKAFLKQAESIIQAPILCYPNPNKRYIVYTDASEDTFIPGTCWYRIPYCLSFTYLFWKHKENGASQNKKLMQFIMPLPNEIIIYREQAL